jgi:hypothetical protein
MRRHAIIGGTYVLYEHTFSCQPGYLRDVEFGIHLTVVPTQGEADVICGMLRAAGIRCGDRTADGGGLTGMLVSGGGWREILVAEADLETARKLLASRPL